MCRPTGTARSPPRLCCERFPSAFRWRLDSEDSGQGESGTVRGNDGQSRDYREHRASYVITARTVKFLGRRDSGGPANNRGVP